MIVQFVVDKDGSISNPEVVRGVDPYLDKEAIRVISSMPKWRPGVQNGKKVRVKFTVPVVIQATVVAWNRCVMRAGSERDRPFFIEIRHSQSQDTYNISFPDCFYEIKKHIFVGKNKNTND